MINEMKLPSKVLNREFVLPEAEVVVEQIQSADSFRAITTHAVLVGNIGLLLPSVQVSELIDKIQVCRLPNSPGWFNGVASVRGNMIPVFDLHELLGVEGKGQARKVITVGTGETAVAFWVDEMPRIVMVTSDDLMATTPPLPPLIKDHAVSYFIKDEQIWIDWDVQEFFSKVGGRLLG